MLALVKYKARPSHEKYCRTKLPASSPNSSHSMQGLHRVSGNNGAIDRVLIDSSLEREAIVKALEGWDEAGGKDRERRALRAIKALRVEVVRHLLGGISFRCLSQELGRSELLANFAGA